MAARSTDPERDLRVTEEHVLASGLDRSAAIGTVGKELVAHPVNRQGCGGLPGQKPVDPAHWFQTMVSFFQLSVHRS